VTDAGETGGRAGERSETGEPRIAVAVAIGESQRRAEKARSGPEGKGGGGGRGKEEERKKKRKEENEKKSSRGRLESVSGRETGARLIDCRGPSPFAAANRARLSPGNNDELSIKGR